MKHDFDVLIVGAGIHGCGVGQAAARLGLSTLVLEKSAIAAGTSSRSSKLIHGGLRYLETAQIRLVRESLYERRYMLKHMPELVHALPMHIPVYDGMQRGPLMIRAGLSAYALLGGDKFRSLPRSEWAGLDGLETRGLRAVFRYAEAQTDDAELTRAVLGSAVEKGAAAWVPAELLGAAHDADGVTATIRYQDTERTVTARVLVNAAGPWVERVAQRINPDPLGPSVELVQGAHVEYEGALDTGAFYVESPDDGRAVFVLPHGDRTLVGTTETRFTGDPDRVAPTAAECTYLHAAFSRSFPGRAGQSQCSSWAGLRVLPTGDGPANRRSRETILHVAGRTLAIYGGKLTTWRATADRVMALLRPHLG